MSLKNNFKFQTNKKQHLVKDYCGFFFIVLGDVREVSPLSDKVTTRQDTTKANCGVHSTYKRISIKKNISLVCI